MRWRVFCFMLAAGVTLAMPSAAQSPKQPANGSGPDAYTVMGRPTKLPNGGRPEKHTPIPAIRDWNTLRISLRRETCLGPCPAYDIEIDGDGAVRYRGYLRVALTGAHQARISQDVVRELFRQFAKADFFWTLDEYAAGISDQPAYTLKLSFDGRSKKVWDYAGQMIGMPDEITQLENAVDAAAGIDKWVKGGPDNFATLVAEQWDFRATDDDHLALLDTAAERQDTPLLTKLVSAGVSTQSWFGCMALARAAEKQNWPMLQALIAAHAPTVWKAPPDLMECNVLAWATEQGSPQVVQAILDLHSDVNWRDEHGRSILMLAAQFSSPQVVQLLLERGADPWKSYDGSNGLASARSNATPANLKVIADWMAAHKKSN